jgi:hypothetical protein
MSLKDQQGVFMKKIIFSLVLIICLLFFITSLKDLALLGIVASVFLLFITAIEDFIGVFKSQISELNAKLHDVNKQIEEFKSNVDYTNDVKNKFNDKLDYTLQSCISELSDKFDMHLNDINEKISNILEYETWQIPEQSDRCSFPLDWAELEKIMLEIANMTLTGCDEENEALPSIYLTYILIKSSFHDVPFILTKLNSIQRENFIRHYNLFRGRALRYGLLSEYDKVGLQINFKEVSKHNVIDVLLDNVLIIKKQNDVIISKINDELIQNDVSFGTNELIERGIIKDHTLYGGCFEYSQYKEKAFDRVLYKYLCERLGQNYTVQAGVESCGFTLDLVITNHSSKKTIAIEYRCYECVEDDNTARQRRRILENAGWKIYEVCYYDYNEVPRGKKIWDWFTEEFERKNIVQDIIKLID